MPVIAAIRQAEEWTAANLLGALFLLAVVVVVGFWLVRRYLRD